MLPNSLQFLLDTSAPSTSTITSPGYIPAKNAAEPCVTVYTTVSAVSPPLTEMRPYVYQDSASRHKNNNKDKISLPPAESRTSALWRQGKHVASCLVEEPS